MTAADRRPLEVTSGKTFHDWLLRNVGGPELPGFFVRGGELVRVPKVGEDGYIAAPSEGDDDGPAQVRPADARVLRAVIAHRFDCFKVKESKGVVEEIDVLPTLDPVVTFTAGVGEPAVRTPRLDVVAHSPVLRPDGTVLDRPGYDKQSKTLYLPPDDLHRIEPVPARPTDAQVAAAIELLLEPFAEFPWVTESDKATYLGMTMFTPVLRPLVPPPYPALALSAHQQGSGKTLLAELPRILHGGVLRSELSAHDEEVRKSIHAVLRTTTGPIVTFDNVTGIVRSGAFAMLLTAREWSDRTLGGNSHEIAVNDRVWVLTGNNLALGGDIPRRVVWARIDPNTPRPWLRTGYKHPNLPGYFTAHRGEILRAILIVARAWVLAGRPSVDDGRADNYGHFIGQVGGLLRFMGLEGVFADPAVAEEASPVATEDDEAYDFLHALQVRFSGDPFTAADLAKLVTTTSSKLKVNEKAEAGNSYATFHPVKDDDAEIVENLPGELAQRMDRGGFTKSLGWWLTNRVGRWVGSSPALVLRKSGAGHRRLYHVEVRP
ncbi:MAG: hypothetical protein R2737_10350 [Candidatus Nanopelagicales bacterium]